jgi:hypothetical protein
MNFHDDTAAKNEPENHLFYRNPAGDENPVIHTGNCRNKVKKQREFFLAPFVRILKKALT